MKTEYNRKAELYDKFRWNYPDEAVAWAVGHIPQMTRRTAVDAGAGTGLLTRKIAGYFDIVYGIEPDDGMAHILEAKKIANLRILRKLAHDAGEIQAGSACAVFSAHALHWFDYDKTIVEFNRILDKDGLVVSFQNSIDDEGPIAEQAAEIIKKYTNSALVTKHRTVDVNRYFSNPCEKRFPFVLNQDFIQYVNGLSSASFLPDESMPGVYSKYRDELHEAFRTHAEDGRIISRCSCTVKIGGISAP